MKRASNSKNTSAGLKYILTLMLLAFAGFLKAQILKEWHGNWEGTMYIYGKGKLRDSVPVVLTVATIDDSTLVWRTEYKSASQPMVKDYKMTVIDSDRGIYGTDEGNGLVLTNYLIDDALYSVFQVQGILLTAIYRLEGEQIVFEVTSGKKDTVEVEGVSNYAVSSIQKVNLKRQSHAESSNITVNEPLYLLEGKTITKHEMERIDPQTLDSVHVLKGDAAIKEYGSRAKNGVVLIKRKTVR